MSQELIVSDKDMGVLEIPKPGHRPKVAGSVLLGLLTLLLFIGGLLAFSALAPLSSGAVAQGEIAVPGNIKTVQHLEGGIIRELLVTDGDRVGADQVLLRLDDAQARASWELIQGQWLALKAQEARLIAERDGVKELIFPPELTAVADDDAARKILRGQEAIFTTRRKALEGQRRILMQRKDQLRAEIASMQAQVKSAEAQMKLIRQEMKGVEALVRKGLERKARLLGLQRQAAGLEGSRGEQLGLIARTRQRIGETEIAILNLENERLTQVTSDLRDVQAKLADLEERRRAARDVLDRRTIRAPQGGVVVNMRFFTPGGVIGPGQPILDIVPETDELTVEARIRPVDIDVIKTGMRARVTLAAFKQRTTPTLLGRVVYVSADALEDPRTGQPYYLARIEVSPEEKARLGKRRLMPGMPASVSIEAGEKTLLEYLIDPMRDNFRGALSEQ